MAQRPIRDIIEGYNEAKYELQLCVKEVTKRAVELGCDTKMAEDVRISLAYLHGYLRSKP